MATAQTEKTSEQDQKETERKLAVRGEEHKVSAEDIEKLKEDPRFDLPSQTIKTAEDAYQAYLREEIDEGELRAVVAALGGSPFYSLKSNLERPDNAFERSVPEDLYDDPSIRVTPLEDRLKRVEERDKQAEKATKEAEAEAAKSKS